MSAPATSAPTTAGATSTTLFQTACSENDQMIRLSLDLPGVLLKDMEVGVQRGVLLVKGLRKTSYLSHSSGYSYCKHHKFCRRFALDTDVIDLQRMKANLTKGVLVIQAPKKNRPTILTIQVTEGEEHLRNEEDVVGGARGSVGKCAEEREEAAITTPAATPSLKPTSAPLPHVISKDEVLEATAAATMISLSVPIKRKHPRSSAAAAAAVKSHLKTRRSTRSMNKVA